MFARAICIIQNHKRIRASCTTARSRSVLVVTVVHNPGDSRIWQRQLKALIDAGWDLTHAAPLAPLASNYHGALGVPAITTPLPLAADLVRSENGGIEVP